VEVVEKPKIRLTDLTYEQLAQARSKLTKQIQDAEAVTDAIKAKREKVDREFLARFSQQGLTNVKTNAGTVSIIKRESYSVADKDAFLGWVREHNALDFLETRVSKKMVEVYKDEHEDLPPGVNYSAANTIGLRKA
jgi:hypothetical protein